MRPPEHAVAIVLNVDGRQAGLGFLIGARELVTCAHVVNTAIGRKRADRSPPDSPLRLRFPFVTGKGEITATVSGWFRATDSGDVDLAILSLPVGASDGLTPLVLAERADSGIDVQMCGPSEQGLRHVRGLLVGQAGLGRLQIDQNRGGAFRVAPGFSGGPVWRQSTGEVVGVLRAATLDEGTSGAECLDVAVLHRVRSALRYTQDRPSPGAHPPTVLQLGGTRFTRGDRAAASMLAEAVLTDLARLEHEHRIRPNLLVVGGDLTAGARPPEFGVAEHFLARITETLDLSPEQLIIVPGSSDVNTRLCQAYFAQCEEYDEEPIEPYWDKWGPYSALLERLTGRPLSRAEPWRAHDLAHPSVAVTALNSTFGQSHLAGGPRSVYGDAQLRWIATQVLQEREVPHLVVSHHAPLSTPPSRDPEIQRVARLLHPAADLILTGEDDARVPPLATGPSPVLNVTGRDRYHLIHIQPGHIEIFARRRDPGGDRFIGDTGVDPDGNRWRLRLPWRTPHPPSTTVSLSEPRPPSRLNANLRLVREASRLRDPDAVFVSTEPGEAGGFAYLRAVRRHDFGDGLEPAGEYLIGVLNEPPDRDDLDRFRAEVIDLFRSPGSTPPARIVYFGQLAEATIAAYAQRLGIHVESFQRFQRGWDPRRFVAWQEVELASDRRYPPQLYIPQGFQELGPRGIPVDELGRDSDADREGLPEKVAGWLREPYGHLIVVLGAAGSGKTFFLRTLARELSHVDSPVTPIYLPVRDLDRLPEIDEVVAAYLTRAGEERLNPTRFNYLLKEGRIALLLDGLDELTAQSSYERAIAHLREIGGKAQRLAKIVVTARDVEFLSNTAVLEALGGTSAVTEGRRALRVAEFSSKQIEEFLTRLLGSGDAARRRIELLGGLGQLPEVARNPRMLSFIAAIDEDRLMEARAAGEGRLTGADLYEQVLDQWITGEVARLTRPSQLPPLNSAELWRAVRTLALHLWRTDREHATIEDLGLAAAALSQLDDEEPIRPEADVRVHQLGAGSLLVRHEDGELGFIHRSIREWLVARALSPLPGHDPASPLSLHRLTSQTAQFICELNGRLAVWNWIDGLTADHGPSDTSLDNALALQRFVGGRPPADRRTVTDPADEEELNGPQDLTTRYLGAYLPGRDLRDRQLAGLDFTGANMPNADLSGNDLTGVRFTDVTLSGARLLGAKLTDASLVGADLTGANLNGADLSRTRLDNARLRRAALLGTQVDASALSRADTLGAAVSDDLVTVQLRPSKVGDVSAVDPTGQLVASGDKHGWLHLWDLETGQPIRQWQALPGRVNAVCWSPDGQGIFAGGQGIGYSDAIGGEVMWSQWIPSIQTIAVAWSPQPDRLATIDSVGDVTVRSTDPRDPLVVSRPVSRARALTWSPDGAYLAIAGENGFVVVHPGGSEPIARCETVSNVTAIAWSPDGRYIATGNTDGTIETWKATTFTHQDMAHAHVDAVHALAWAPDSASLFSGGEDKTLRQWHVWKLTEAHHFEDDTSPIRSISVSHDGSTLVANSRGRIRAWRLAALERPAWTRTDETLSAATRTIDWIRAAAWSPDGNGVVSGSDSGELRIWDLRTGRTTRKHYEPTRALLAVDWSGDGQNLATGDDKGEIALWKRDLRPLPSWTGKTYIRTVRWSPDSSRLATGGDDEYVRVWDPARRDAVHRWRLNGRVRDVVWSPDGHRLYAAGRSGALGCWSTESGRQLWRLSGVDDAILALCVTETLVLTGDSTGRLRLFSADHGEQIADWDAHGGSVTAISWNAWEHQIVSAGTDGHVRIWDPNTHNVIHEWLAHAGWISSLSHSPDGRHLLTSGDDNVLRIWQAGTGTPVATLVPLADGHEAVLYGDGLTYKLNGNADGRFWYASAQVRFEPTEADEYVPNLVRVTEDHPIL